MSEGKKWYEYAGDDSDVIVNTRVNVARNLAGTPFAHRMKAADRKAVLSAVLEAAGDRRLSIAGQLRCSLMEELTKTEAVALAERGVVSPEFIAKREGRALLCSGDESLSVAVNGGEHLLISAMRPGLDLDGASNAADHMESILSRVLEFAFDPEFGYLTEDPANLGTGMHAEMTLHLPALSRSGALGRVAAGLSQLGLRLREGVGAEAGADLYRLSNRVTLGISEQEAVFNLKSMSLQVVLQERAARKSLCGTIECQDQIFRAYGILKNARLLPLNEFMQAFSNLRLGVAQQMFREGPPMDVMAPIMAAAQPANLMLRAGRALSKAEQNAFRGKLVRAALEGPERKGK